MAAAISGMVIGAAGLAHASTHGNNTASSSDGAAQQLDDSAGKHSCKGKNACKGQGGCKSEKHACKGQNACKGQGGCKG
jgi:hypothetical protein